MQSLATIGTVAVMGWPLLEVDLPVHYLLDSSLLLAACSGLMLLYILVYLAHFLGRRRRVRQLRELFSPLITEAVIADTDEELATVLAQDEHQALIRRWLKRRLARRVFLSELIRIRRGMSGRAEENIRGLYRHLDLHQDSMRRLADRRWHRKAAAIQELALMGETDCLAHIYRAADHRNFYVRSEAQVALVKLTGVDGLRFLDEVRHPITPWQQICLLQQLALSAGLPADGVARWLRSGNETVVQLALRMAGAFKLYELHEAAAACLQHESAAVRAEAVRTLAEIGPEEMPDSLPFYLPGPAVQPEHGAVTLQNESL